MTATLRVTRQVSFAFELRRGRFEVSVDGANVGALERNDTLEKPLEPGHHTLLLRAGRYSSGPHPFDAADGEVVSFRCHAAQIWPIYVVSLLKPDLAISLKRD